MKIIPIPLEGMGHIVDTTCNSMCIHCGPVYSSMWRDKLSEIENYSDNRIIRAEYRTREKTPAEEIQEVKNISSEWFNTIEQQTELKINGGEPLQSIKTMNLIRETSEHQHAKNLNLRVYTSGSLIPDEFFELSNKFKSAKLMFSIDATHDKYEYLRWPTKWIDVENNVKKSDELVKVGFVCTVHSLNLSSVPEIYDWIWSLNLRKVDNQVSPLVYKFVHKPTWLDARYVEQETKHYINQVIWDFLGEQAHNFGNDYFNGLRGCLDFLWQHKNNRKNELLREFIISMDKYRSTDFSTVFSDLDKQI